MKKSHLPDLPKIDPVSDLRLLESQIFAIAYLLEVADADAPPDQMELNGIGLLVRNQAEALQAVRRFLEDQDIERSGKKSK